LRAEPQIIQMLQTETDDHEVEIAVRQEEDGACRIGLPHHVKLGIQRIQDTLGGAVAVLDKQNPAAASKLVHARAQAAGKAQLLLARGTHQHLVAQHLQPREIPNPRDRCDVVDRLGEKVVGPGLEPLHPVRRLIKSGDRDHGDVLRARIGLEAPADLEAVPCRASSRPLTRADVQRFRAAMSRTHLEIVGGKARLEQLDVGVGVVDDEYTCGHGVATVPRR